MMFRTAFKKVSDFAGQAGAFWVEKGNIENRLKNEFDKTKAVSDFVGMIVRFGFALAATTYFGKRVTEPSLRLESYIFVFCWMTSLGVTIALVSGIMNIIFAYEMRAVGDSKRLTTRLIFFALAVISTLCLWYGVNDLAGAIAGTFAPNSKK